MHKMKDKAQNEIGNKLFINCREATHLIVVNESDKINLIQRIALSYHLFICKVCRYFQKQSAALNEFIKKNESEQSVSLSSEKKEEILRKLNELK